MIFAVDNCFTVAGQVRPACCGDPLTRDSSIDVYLQTTGRWKKQVRLPRMRRGWSQAVAEIGGGVGIEPTHRAGAATRRSSSLSLSTLMSAKSQVDR